MIRQGNHRSVLYLKNQSVRTTIRHLDTYAESPRRQDTERHRQTLDWTYGILVSVLSTFGSQTSSSATILIAAVA